MNVFFCGEAVIVNAKCRSGLRKRFFVDPENKLGLCAIVSVFYKDDSEILLSVHWKVGTPEMREASLGAKGGIFAWRVFRHRTAPSFPLSIIEEISVLKERWRCAGEECENIDLLDSPKDLACGAHSLIVRLDVLTARESNLRL